MSWFLFLDESGHDHKHMPYEVRGGIALHVSKLWPFVQAMRRLEFNTFGCELQQYGKELKGSSLVDRKRFQFAHQQPQLEPDSRRKHCRGFFTKGLEKKSPSKDEFSAYGQACIEMALGIFELLVQHEATLFAVAIPPVPKPKETQFDDYLRKDQVFLLERFFYFLEDKQEQGVLVADEVEKVADRRFVRRLESYFINTDTGRYRSQWIVPAPFFVSSDMTSPIQAADLCIYCVNWGFRLPGLGMDAKVRPEIYDKFSRWIEQLQFQGEGYRDGVTFRSFGICYVANPYEAERA